MAKPLHIVEEAQIALVQPEEILYLVTEMAKRHQAEESIDWNTQVMILHARGYSRSPGKVFAIMERLRCLAKLMKDDRMRGWSMEAADDPDCTLTNEVIFCATALSPLHIVGEKFKFDADEFFSIALSETDAEGNA